MPSFWLVKSEPAKYAFADLVRDGKTVWDGVRNNAAALHLKAMRVGDEVLYYHSQEGLAVVGVARVVKEAFPDATDPAGTFRGRGAGAGPRTEASGHPGRDEGNPALSGLEMIRQGRLSVSPVRPEEWKTILAMAGE